MHMSASAQWKAYWLAGLVALLTDFVWMVLSPLYEEGVTALTSPFLCALGVLFFVFYLRKSPWAYRYSAHYAVGTGLVMALFIGKHLSTSARMLGL